MQEAAKLDLFVILLIQEISLTVDIKVTAFYLLFESIVVREETNESSRKQLS